MKLRFILSLSFLFAVLGFSQQVPQQVTESLNTNVGELKIIRIGNEDGIPEETVFLVQLNRRTIATINEVASVSFYAHFMQLEMGEIVILSVSARGNACPALYRIIQLQSAERYVVTQEFGDCSDTPTVIQEPERITVRFPGYYALRDTTMPGFRPPPPKTWIFHNSVLREVRIPSTPRRRRN